MLAYAIGFLMVIEVMVVAHINMRDSNLEAPNLRITRASDNFVNSKGLGTWGRVFYLYEAVHANIGWLRGFGYSYISGDSACIGIDEPGYVGEYCQGTNRFSPTYWSPNHLKFSGLNPNLQLVINENPGSCWYKKSTNNTWEQLFPNYRAVELTHRFIAYPNHDGTLEIIYSDHLRYQGMIATIIFAILLAVTIFAYRKTNN
jgi:hypothetical protein